jgi:hypothetical protein
VSSFYDNQPPPPSRQERKERGETMVQQVQEFSDDWLYYKPDYSAKPRSKRPEMFVVIVLALLGVGLFLWSSNTLNTNYPTDFIENELPRIEQMQDKMIADYDKLCPHCYLIGEEYEEWTQSGLTIEEWRIKTGVDPPAIGDH